MNWLKAIKDYLAANVEIAPADDLMRDQPFSGWGGVVAAQLQAIQRLRQRSGRG